MSSNKETKTKPYIYIYIHIYIYIYIYIYIFVHLVNSNFLKCVHRLSRLKIILIRKVSRFALGTSNKEIIHFEIFMLLLILESTFKKFFKFILWFYIDKQLVIPNISD